MTYNEAIKEIEDYFNLDLKPFDSKRLKDILVNVVLTEGKPREYVKTEKVIKERVFIYPKGAVKSERVDLNEFAEKACSIYNITMLQFMSKSRQGDIISARAHFCREVINTCPKFRQLSLAAYLRKDHTTIVNYLYYSKCYCEIPPLEEMAVNYKMRPNPLKVLKKKKLRKNVA